MGLLAMKPRRAPYADLEAVPATKRGQDVG